MMKLKVLELFSGIRALSKALEKLGIDYECVDSVEIDKYAIKSQNAIYGTNFKPQDITQWDKDIEVDLIMHGSPCQDFSLAGKQAGGDKDSGTRSSLLYETVRIVSKLKPKYVIWENVKNVLSQKHRHNFDNYLKEMEELGYTNYYQVLNAKDYGIPQNRERVFTISIRNDFDEDGIEILDFFDFPPKQELKLRLKDMLEDEVDEKYYLNNSWFRGNFSFENKTIGETRYDEGIRTFKDNMCGSLRTIDAGGNKCVIIKEATKKGYKEAYEGDGVYINRPHQKRGVVQKQMIQTIKCSADIGVVVKNQGKEIVRETDISTTLLARDYKGFGNQEMTGVYDNLRIRKLSTLECFRLMGFDDLDFEKASQVCSNSQLYKQAGNSICVPVLENILKELFKEE